MRIFFIIAALLSIDEYCANGIQPQGTASLNSNEGLQIKCNDFTNNIFQYHIAVTSGDIGDPQGVCDLADKSSPAGNTFTHECNFTGSDIAAHGGTFFRYNHHSDLITTPVCYDAVAVDPNACTGLPFDPIESCPSHLVAVGGGPCSVGPGGSACRIVIDQISRRAQLLQNQFDSLVDGGNTQAMLNIIATQSLGNIKESILSISPFASDEVLIAAINKNHPLSFGNIKEIIIANSPVSDTVYQSLINRTPALPNGILKEINDAQVGISPRDSLEGLIRFLVRQRSIAVNNLNRLYLNDTTINGIDSVIAVLEQEEGEARKMQLASAYIANNDFAEATQLLDSLENIAGFENFATINRFIMDVFEDSATFDALLVDTALRQTVEGIADDTLKFGYLTARAIISQVFGTIYPELIEELPQQQLKWAGSSGHDTLKAPVTEIEQLIKDSVSQPDESYFVKLYPNPATNKLTVEYLLPEKSNHGTIAFYNVLGMSNEIAIEGNNGKKEIDIVSWNSGVYYYTVIVNNNTIARKIIVVMKN